MVEGVCATSGVLGDECLQISFARHWSAASDNGIFGYVSSARTGSPFDFDGFSSSEHWRDSKGLLGVQDDKLRTLVQLVLDHLPVLE